MNRFQNLDKILGQRRDAWARWVNAVSTSDGDDSERRAAWQGVCRWDEAYHNEVQRLFYERSKTVKVSSLPSQDHPAWESFCRAMDGRSYGVEETLDAWHWFKSGWDGTE